MPLALADPPDTSCAVRLPPRVWLYTNYDCNLSCSYCVAESYPKAERRGLPLDTARRVIDEATELGFEELFITGGEPFILPSIFDLLEYALPRMRTTVLSNGVSLRRKKLQRLLALPQQQLTIQISLDGATAEVNDACRGAGSWKKATDAILRLRDAGCHVRLGTTLTPENGSMLPELCALHRNLGIPDDDHIVRPLVRRGFSLRGIALALPALVPEITVNRDGVYWHPVSTDEDLLVTGQIFPFSHAVAQIEGLLASVQLVTGGAASQFR